MTTYTVTLPEAGLKGRPHIRPIKQFKDHGTFSAYLHGWYDLGYAVTWPTGVDAVIGGRS